MVSGAGGVSERPVLENCGEGSKDAGGVNKTIYLGRSLSDERFQQGKL